MKRITVLLTALFLCTLLLCACGPTPSDAETVVTGTVTGLIDNRTVEIILEDGTVQSFLFYDAEVAEKLDIAEESDTPITFSYEEKDGQQLMVIVSVK